MKRVKLVLAYDGTNYCGWQLQPNGITIEEVLNNALSELLREPIAVTGASRTDSGVHSEGNVAVFDTENRMPADKICFALNQRLPEDVRVLSSEEVPAGWHPRKQNCVKTYEYRILNRKIDMPTMRLYSHFCYFPLDVERMKEAASYLVGEHDFKSFCSARSQSEETVRTIYSLDVTKSGDMITIRISGSGFLYNMVRIIAGTLMKVGMGVYPPEHMEAILDARDRQAAGPKVPAKGLTLMGLEYEKELREQLAGENKYWKYRLIQKEIPTKKKAYLMIDRCVPDDYERTITRVVHQAVRNGARTVYVCDKEIPGRLWEGRQFGYYTLEKPYEMIYMVKSLDEKWRFSEYSEPCRGEIGAADSEKENLRRPVMKRLFWETCTEDQIREFCSMFNEIFDSVPNSATMTVEEVEKSLKDAKEEIFLVQYGDAAAGFSMVKTEEDSLEVRFIGVRREFRGLGIARAILAAAEQSAVSKGLNTLNLTVAGSNCAAYQLYKSIGFHEEKVLSCWYSVSAAGYPEMTEG